VRLHAFRQLSPASIIVARQPLVYQKEPHYHFSFFISSLMKRIFSILTKGKKYRSGRDGILIITETTCIRGAKSSELAATDMNPAVARCFQTGYDSE
jgi:hypothetical protein